MHCILTYTCTYVFSTEAHLGPIGFIWEFIVTVFKRIIKTN